MFIINVHHIHIKSLLRLVFVVLVKLCLFLHGPYRCIVMVPINITYM